MMNHDALLLDLLKNKKKFKGKILLASHSRYHQCSQLYNRALKHKPAVVIEIRQVNDICHALNFARKHGIPVSVRGGGHSACGTSVVDNGMVLNMSALKDIKFSPNRNRVYVMAGVLNHELDKTTLKHGQALPLGTCKGVGVIGSSIGGGIGFLSRTYGLTCDNIERITMVDAMSNVIQVDSEHHPDLFWALRGAGANQFGVITGIEYKTFNLPEKFYGGIIDWPIKYGKEILRHYSDMMLSAPDNVFLYAYISHSSQDSANISIMGYCMGDVKESEKIFSEIKNWCPQAEADLKIRSYLDMQSNVYQDNLGVYWKHGIVEKALTDEFIDALLECFYRCPDNSGGIMLDPLGGAINRVNKSATAFIHRDARFICSVTGLSQGSLMPNATKNWVRRSHQILEPFFNGMAYQNYEDLERDEISCYFGEHAERLLEIKCRYDPNNLFNGSLTRKNITKGPT